MQLTIDLPNIGPSEKTAQLIEKIEQFFLKDKLDIEEISVGITDFAQNHDYYLYGTPKKS